MVKLLIVSVTAELPRYYEYYDSMNNLITPPNTELMPIHSSAPAKNRNLAIRAALDGNYTHIFFTDDDHVYRPDTIMKLLSHNVHVISGLYCMKFEPFPPILLDEPNERGHSKFINMGSIEPDKLIKIPRVPAGCLLVTTEILRQIRVHLVMTYPQRMHDMWFTMGQINPDEWCDDLWFCDLVRACGHDIYVDTGVTVGHITKCIIEPHWNGKEWIIKYKINEGYAVR